jgi:hypothetical protein
MLSDEGAVSLCCRARAQPPGDSPLSCPADGLSCMLGLQVREAEQDPGHWQPRHYWPRRLVRHADTSTTRADFAFDFATNGSGFARPLLTVARRRVCAQVHSEVHVG